MTKFLFLLLFAIFLSANNNPILQRELNNQSERLKQFQESSQGKTINLGQDLTSSSEISLTLNETPCFEIDEIILDDKGSAKFQTYLKETLEKLNYKRGLCLGERSINAILNALNNKIISKGYTTSLVSIKPLNLRSRKIEFELNLGKIDKISINGSNSNLTRSMIFTAFGEIVHNKTLNIRKLEQALENISNSTFGEVSISLVPSDKQNFTDILINKNQNTPPISLSLSLDNYGSKQTGRYQGSVGVSGVNLLGLNEIYTLSLGKDMFNKEKTYLNDSSDKGSSHNHYVNFTIPFGYLNLSYTNSSYYYNQILLGANRLYEYSGRSRVSNLALSYMLHRDQAIKTKAFLNLFKRSSKNYIEDYELSNQRRVSAGYEIGLRSNLNMPTKAIMAQISYKKGTGMLNTLAAPEQRLNEGTARMKIWLFDLGYKQRLSDKFSYDSSIHGQYNNTPLTLQDRLSIGGIYSIRGFNSQMSLVGQRGFFIRNTISFSYINNHAIYTALDAGAVYSPTSGYEGSNKLAGGGVGLRGEFKLLKAKLNYDLLASMPIYKPRYFKTDKVHLGFRVGAGW